MKTFRALLALLLAASLGGDLVSAQVWRTQWLASFDEVWQTVHDTFFDPTFGGLDWDGVKAELRPKVQAADSAESVRQIIRDMLGRLHQSHFVLLSSESVAETLPGFEAVAWFGIVAPPKTPQNIVDKINADVNEALHQPALQDLLGKLSAEIFGGSIEKTSKYMGDEVDRWHAVIKAANIESQ